MQHVNGLSALHRFQCSEDERMQLQPWGPWCSTHFLACNPSAWFGKQSIRETMKHFKRWKFGTRRGIYGELYIGGPQVTCIDEGLWKVRKSRSDLHIGNNEMQRLMSNGKHINLTHTCHDLNYLIVFRCFSWTSEVGAGYLQRPELTAERFVCSRRHSQFVTAVGEKVFFFNEPAIRAIKVCQGQSVCGFHQSGAGHRATLAIIFFC